LVHVLTEPKNAVVKQFAAMFKLAGIELEFTPDALSAVAARSIKRKTGARGLRGVIEANLLRTQFDLPDLASDGVARIVVDRAVIENGTMPSYVHAATVSPEMALLPPPAAE
jgi:ATP-dependent Clp protease ATP-binding subunit ClpX